MIQRLVQAILAFAFAVAGRLIQGIFGALGRPARPEPPEGPPGQADPDRDPDKMPPQEET